MILTIIAIINPNKIRRYNLLVFDFLLILELDVNDGAV